MLSNRLYKTLFVHDTGPTAGILILLDILHKKIKKITTGPDFSHYTVISNV